MKTIFTVFLHSSGWKWRQRPQFNGEATWWQLGHTPSRPIMHFSSCTYQWCHNGLRTSIQANQCTWPCGAWWVVFLLPMFIIHETLTGRRCDIFSWPSNEEKTEMIIFPLFCNKEIVTCLVNFVDKSWNLAWSQLQNRKLCQIIEDAKIHWVRSKKEIIILLESLCHSFWQWVTLVTQ